MTAVSEGSHIIDLAEVIPDAAERSNLLHWGATYLSGDDEDATIRSASLALEVYAMLRKRNRYSRHVSAWQCRLSAIAFVTAAHRLRRELMEVQSVRH